MTFLENDHNYAVDSGDSVLYVRICFEGMDDLLKKNTAFKLQSALCA